MAQISAPFRIALLAIVLLGGVWFVALRPKSEAAPTPAPVAPGVQGLSRAVQKARATTAAANAAAAKSQAAANAAVNGTGGQSAPVAKKPAATKTTTGTVTKTSKNGATSTTTVTKTKTTKPAAPKAVVVKPKAKPKAVVVPASASTPLIRALNHGKVVVLMFRNRSSDSAAVAASVRKLSRHHGKVVIRVVSISDVGKYSAFTRDTPVNQAPTTLIIGPSRKARVIVGFTDGGELGQAVDDLIVAKSEKKKK